MESSNVLLMREMTTKGKSEAIGRSFAVAILGLWLVPLLVACSGFDHDDSLSESHSLESASASPTYAPTPTPAMGSMRTDPVPHGLPLTLQGVEVTVLDTLFWRSGQLLFKRVRRDGNITGETTLRAPDASEGFEWLVVEVRLRNVGDPNRTKIFGPTHFKVAARSGSIYEVADVPPKKQRKPLSFAGRWEWHLGKQYLDSGEFFGESELTGYLISKVAKEDDEFVLIYSPSSADSRYLSLKESAADKTAAKTPIPVANQTWPLPPRGAGRTNPVPYGESFTHDDVEITVLEVNRLSKEGRFFSGLSLREPPLKGYHYVGIKLRLRNVGNENDTRSYSKDHFWITGSLGLVHSDVITPERGEFHLNQGEFFGGGEIIGAIAAQVPSADNQLVLIYSPPFSSDASFYSLEASPR